MRDQTTQAVLDVLAANGIMTALCARLDFSSETVCVWTGSQPMQPTGSGDSLLDGMRFEPLAHGVVLNIGYNSYSYSGSDALEIALAVPSSPSTAIAAAEVFPTEYLGRPATLWRALMVQPANPLAQPTWLFRRVRAGAMDKVEITNDGNSHTFKLVIESHASLISAATQSTYMDQKTKFDTADTSQDYAAAIANGSAAPSKSNINGNVPGMLAWGQNLMQR